MQRLVSQPQHLCLVESKNVKGRLNTTHLNIKFTTETTKPMFYGSSTCQHKVNSTEKPSTQACTYMQLTTM
jgi:hypothetical protein